MTAIHNRHKVSQAEYLKSGGSTLFPEELELLGELEGKKLVHLQCNSGQDSLSLVQMGAVVTGVDISDEAVSFARQLASDAGLRAEFIRADIYDWFRQAIKAGRHFDIAFSSYGALCWLSDLHLWAQGIRSVLEPGGKFVLVEFHPFLQMLDDDWHLASPYTVEGKPTVYENGIGDYVAMSGELLAVSGYVAFEAPPNPHAVYEFQWGVGDICSALIDAGLRISKLVEYPYINGCKMFPRMRELPGRRLVPPEDVPQNLPLMIGIIAINA